MQGAAFEKNGRSDAGSVMHREALDVENQALWRRGRFLWQSASHRMTFSGYEINGLSFISIRNISHIYLSVNISEGAAMMISPYGFPFHYLLFTSPCR
jgi:hypothetical protein